MTLTIILWATAAAIIFGMTNAFAYRRGANAGYKDGLKTGITAAFQKIQPGEYKIVWDGEEDEE